MKNYNLRWLEELTKQKRLNEEKESLRKTLVNVVPSCSSSDKVYLTDFGTVLDDMCQISEVAEFLKMKGWKHSGDSQKEETFIKLKSTTVPAFTLSTYTESGGSLKAVGDRPRNPYIIVDIDFKSVSEATQEVFDKINSLPFVIGSAVSISGMGFWSIVKIDISRIKSKKEWKTLYQELCAYYEDEDIELDIQCSNINRLRVFSPYQFIWNDNYEEAYVPMLLPVNVLQKEDSSEYEAGEFGNRAFKENYQSGNMHWKRLVWANTILNVYGESGEDLYRSIFSEDPDYDDDLENTWNWCCNNRGSHESNSYCLRILKEMGWIRKKPQVIDIDNLDITNNTLFDF